LFVRLATESAPVAKPNSARYRPPDGGCHSLPAKVFITSIPQRNTNVEQKKDVPDSDGYPVRLRLAA
jgi:hypothetical protein